MVGLIPRSTLDIYRRSERPPLEFRVGSSTIVCPRHNLGGLYSILFGGTYHPVLSRISRSDIVIDGGANVGVFSLLAAQRARRVIAVEPEAENFRFLSENLRRNGVDNVIPVRAALWSKEGLAGFDGFGEVGHLSSRGSSMVSTVALDSLGAGPPSVIKLDIEGAEPTVLGASSKLGAVHSLVYERDPRALSQLRSDRPAGLDPLEDYETLELSLRRSGFALSTYGQGQRVTLANLFHPDMIRSEMTSRLFGTRFAIAALVNNHENVLRPVYPDGFRIVYALRSLG